MDVGRQYVAQDRVHSSEPVSTLLFATARQVAADQGLFESCGSLGERREAFHTELQTILRDINDIEQIARRQFTARELRSQHVLNGGVLP